MKVFQLRADSEKYASLEFMSETDSKAVLRCFDGTPLAKNWVPLEMTRSASVEEHDLDLSDFPALLSASAPVFSRRAWETLAPLIHDQSEELPFVVRAEDFVLLNVLQIADALDEANSEVMRFSDGRIMDVERYVFHPDVVSGLTIFKIPQMRRSHVMVTEPFVEAVRGADLKGFDFELLWGRT